MAVSNCLYLYHTEQPYIRFHLKETSPLFEHSVELNYATFFFQHGQDAMEREIVRLVAENNIDLILVFHFVDNFQLPPDFIRQLQKRSAVVFWMFDDETYLHAHSKYTAQTADAIISTDYFGRYYYEQIGIPTLLYFSAFSRREYFPEPLERDIDVSFVGALRKADRCHYLQVLRDNGIAVQTFGPDSSGGPLSLDDMRRVFCRSKINLNFTAMEQPGWIVREDPMIRRVRQNKGRPIEIALTGSFCLSEAAPPLEKLFEPGREVGVFVGEADLLQKVRYYLEHADERETVAQRAYEKSAREYESSVYFEQIVSELSALLDKRRSASEKDPLLLSAKFKNRHVAFLVVSAGFMVATGRVRPAFQTFRHAFNYGIFRFLVGIGEIFAFTRATLRTMGVQNAKQLIVRFRKKAVTATAER